MKMSKKVASFLAASVCLVASVGCSADAEEEAVATSEQALSPKSGCVGFEARLVDRSEVGTGGRWAIDLYNYCASWQRVRVDIASFPDTGCVWVAPNGSYYVESDFFHWDPPTIRNVVEC